MAIMTPIILNIKENRLDLGDNSIVEVMEKNDYPLIINTNEDLSNCQLVMKRQGNTTDTRIDLELTRKRLLVCKFKEKDSLNEFENGWSYITETKIETDSEMEPKITTITYEGILRKYVPDTVPTFLAGVDRIFEYDITEEAKITAIETIQNEESAYAIIKVETTGNNEEITDKYEFEEVEIKSDLKEIPDAPLIESKLNVPEKIIVSTKININISELEIGEEIEESLNHQLQENEDENLVTQLEENGENSSLLIEEDDGLSYIEEEEEEEDENFESTENLVFQNDNGELILQIKNLELKLSTYDEENGRYYYKTEEQMICTQEKVDTIPIDDIGFEDPPLVEEDDQNISFYKDIDIEKDISNLNFLGSLTFSFSENNFEEYECTLEGNLDLTVSVTEKIEIDIPIDVNDDEDNDEGSDDENSSELSEDYPDKTILINESSPTSFIYDKNGNKIPYYVPINSLNLGNKYIEYIKKDDAAEKGYELGYILLETYEGNIYINSINNEYIPIHINKTDEKNLKLILEVAEETEAIQSIKIINKNNDEREFTEKIEENGKEYIYINLSNRNGLHITPPESFGLVSEINEVNENTNETENEENNELENREEKTEASITPHEQVETFTVSKDGNISFIYSKNSFSDVVLDFGEASYTFEKLDNSVFLDQMSEDDYINLYRPVTEGNISIESYDQNGFNEILLGVIGNSTNNYFTNGEKIKIIAGFSSSDWSIASENNMEIVIANISNFEEVKEGGASPIFLDASGEKELIGDPNKLYIISELSGYTELEGKITNIDIYKFSGDKYDKIYINNINNEEEE